jgi:dienelactone hydrolase
MKIIITLLLVGVVCRSFGQEALRPDTVIVRSGNLELKALLWHPKVVGKLPAVIFCHGGYETNDITYDPLENISTIGSVFAKHGYVFLGLFRSGVALSKGQGTSSGDLMADAFKSNGQEGRNVVQLKQLQTSDLNDAIAGLKFLREQKNVDRNRLAIVGHSLGGSLALLVAEHERQLASVIVFSAAGYSWDRSPQLRARLITAVGHISAPVMIIHAINDYSLNPGYGLDSVLTMLRKPHIFKIYPKFGTTNRQAHNLVFLQPEIWETDVFHFLDGILKH